MEQTCEVLAIYPYPEAPKPCHIVEIVVRGSDGDFPIFDFTQERPGMAEVDWQIPHCAKIMSADGTRVMADGAGTCDEFELWMGDVRMAFYFHHLDPGLPLKTPFGEVALPAPTAGIPERLRGLMDDEEQFAYVHDE